jgi:hypothetical protein
MKNLVFIVGFPRSGTTFLATKLGELKGCVATPETRYLCESVDERSVFSKQVTRGELKSQLCKMQRIQDLGLDLDLALPGPDAERIDRREAFTQLMAAFGAAHNAETVIEKSPVHTYYLPQILRWYPQAQIVAIIRDGRDAFLSLRNTPWGDWPTPRYGADWVYRNRQIARAAASAPERVTLVRFEELVQNQKAVINALAHRLGLPSEAEAESGMTIPSWEEGWKAKAASKADATRIAVWKDHPENDELRAFTAVAGDGLREFGYESSPSTSAGRRNLRLYPVKRGVKQALRKGAILIGQADRISSQKGLERRLVAKD